MRPSPRPVDRQTVGRQTAARRPVDRQTVPGGRPLVAWAVVGFLLLAVAIIYGRTLGFGFLDYDDDSFVRGNREVRAGLTGSSIIWAFTHGPFGEWYPLAMLSHMLDCQLYGLNASGHHLTNVLLHAATAIGLFLVWRSMTGELWPSALVATVFAIHPQHVESVAWIAERRDVLSGLFFVLTLAAYLGYIRHGRSFARYLLMAFVFGLGLMAKAMLVTVPPLLLLLDFWPLGRIGETADRAPNATPPPRPNGQRLAIWPLVLEKLPLVALAVAVGLITLRTHASQGVTVPGAVRAGNAAVACVAYVVHLFYPLDLAVFYPIPSSGWPTWEVAGAVAILCATSAAAVMWRRRFPYFLVGWFWYLGMLSPVLGVVKVGWLSMADRYMYLPAIGLYVALAWGATRLVAGSLTGRWLLATGAGLAIAILMILAVWQTSYWHDDLALWKHALATTEDNAEAETGLADTLAGLNRLDEAVEHYRRAVQLQVDAPLLNNLGTALGRQGKFDEAAAEFSQALEIDPKYAQSYANMGNVLALKGHPAEAAQDYLRAIDLDGSLVLPHFKLANLLLEEDKIDEAIGHLERVIVLEPAHVAARTRLANALAQRGEADRAIDEYLAALAVDPAVSQGRGELVRTLAARGKTNEAATHCGHLLEIAPNNAAVRQMLEALRDARAGTP